jgi:hypothetical protein
MRTVAIIMSSLTGIFISIVVCTAQHDERSELLAGKVRVTLVAERTSYLTGEMIYMEAFVRNLTKQAVQVPVVQQLIYYLDLKVQDENGEFVTAVPVVTLLLPVRKTTLGPLEERSCTISFAHYGNTGHQTCPHMDLRPGQYKVWLTYNDVRSNVIVLNILEPTGRDRVAYETLQYREGQTPEWRIQAYTDLLLSYGTGPYVHNIYYCLIGAYFDLRDRTRVIKLALEYFDRYPDYLGLRAPLLIYRSALEQTRGITRGQAPTADQAQAVERDLLQLKVKYPGKRIGRFVDEELAEARKDWAERAK